MRLINVKTSELEEFLDGKVPPYAILSHTWGEDHEEFTFSEVRAGRIDKPGAGLVKFEGSCRQAEKDGLKYVWVDTCCIDKTSAVELGEAINSMYRWYRGASVCYAYLSDVPGNDRPRDHGSRFRTSRWFQRGWNLQELLAPKNLRFYDSQWCNMGTKGSLWTVLGEIKLDRGSTGTTLTGTPTPPKSPLFRLYKNFNFLTTSALIFTFLYLL
ncbi:heterokaryon incompatibility protein-domain-containing protein [Xylaria telfairii]|nr:heterokaryon incompatibility protein-domain-containing protein [Xylaria telfairii]